MRKMHLLLVALLCTLVSIPVLAAEKKHGIGIGFTTGTGEPDGAQELDFIGGTIFGKIGFTENWGLLISLRGMEDDEDLGLEEDEYTQVGLHAVYMWRPGKRVRPHVKFGAMQTDLEIKLSGLGSVSDDGVAFSVGGGLEAGSERVAFFGDYDFTQVDLFGVDFDFSQLTTGIIFKF